MVEHVVAVGVVGSRVGYCFLLGGSALSLGIPGRCDLVDVLSF